MKDWYAITYCERKNVYDEIIPAEWFILNAPYVSKEETEAVITQSRETLKGTDADWPEAFEAVKVVHRDELVKYGLKPLSGEGSGLDVERDVERANHSDSSESAWWNPLTE